MMSFRNQIWNGRKEGAKTPCPDLEGKRNITSFFDDSDVGSQIKNTICRDRCRGSVMGWGSRYNTPWVSELKACVNQCSVLIRVCDLMRMALLK